MCSRRVPGLDFEGTIICHMISCLGCFVTYYGSADDRGWRRPAAASPGSDGKRPRRLRRPGREPSARGVRVSGRRRPWTSSGGRGRCGGGGGRRGRPERGSSGPRGAIGRRVVGRTAVCRVTGDGPSSFATGVVSRSRDEAGRLPVTAGFVAARPNHGGSLDSATPAVGSSKIGSVQGDGDAGRPSQTGSPTRDRAHAGRPRGPSASRPSRCSAPAEPPVVGGDGAPRTPAEDAGRSRVCSASRRRARSGPRLRAGFPVSDRAWLRTPARTARRRSDGPRRR
jgi:hypothetical protein